ncbi:MAG: polyribonucleotide nucleotidyltransferase [Planctomycetota bacterium]|jgi:polyribonucleotide nucleotidyltransferase
MSLETTKVTCEIAGQTLTLETGMVARQAHGAVIATLGETQVFTAVVTSAGRDDLDFFPLTVDYREKTEAAGKIPGGFFKREGRPTTKEILTMRMIDRSIRPLFPDGFKQEVQVTSRVLGYDGVNNADILAMIASFAAIHISHIPFEGALGAIRIGRVDDKLVVYPSDEERRSETSSLDLIVAGHERGIVMVEAGAEELLEAEMLDALDLAHTTIKTICGAIDELREKIGKPKVDFVAPEVDAELTAAVAKFSDRTMEALFTQGKHERDTAVRAVRKDCLAELATGIADRFEAAARTKAVKEAFHDLEVQLTRTAILDGKRVDGRASDEIREITIAPNFVKRHHGSVLFTRGETQAIVSTTLGTPDDEAIIDGIDDEYRKSFYLHYNFPPYSVGECRRLMGPGRREIGHGALAERALEPILPSKDVFPYTMRVVSEITESNGSSSMASVCGGCLSMMLAGVPLTQPVAGIAMGLVQEGDRTVVLSDILGSEDHTGDMDFKVAGSGLGITALQMDIKVKSLDRALLEKALEQAREGRRYILRKMLEVVSSPSAEVADHAPRMENVMIPSDRIGFLIGPGGKNIKGLQEQFKVRVSVEDTGKVSVFGTNKELVQKCVETISGTCVMPEIGSRYTGTVKGIKDFGAFIEILPGVEGMCHISELDEGFVESVKDIISMGDEVEVVVINVDDRGKIKLSRRQAMEVQEA